MRLSIIITGAASLIIGLAGGYGVGYLLYQPVLRSYEIQVSQLASEVSQLSENISELKAQVSALEGDNSSLQSDLSIAEAKITTYEKQVDALKGQVSNLSLEKSGLQSRINRILNINVTQYYQWRYLWEDWKWELPIPLSLYFEYLEKGRPVLGASYIDLTKDPGDDPYIDSMVQQINSAALKGGFSELEKVNFVIAFVQSLPYTVDLETTPYDEYPRYPIETLFDRGGDCEDTSILTAALLDKMGYDVALLLLENAKHMAVGILSDNLYGSYYEYSGKKYYYLETTGDGWQIGDIPPSIKDTSAQIYPL